MTRFRPTSLPSRWRLGLLAVSSLLACWSLPASGTVTNALLHSTAEFSNAVNEDNRMPVRAFATELGVYEFDQSAKAVRFWQRDGRGRELLLPNGGTNFVPYSKAEAQSERPGPTKFTGVDPAGAGDTFGNTFNYPVSMAKHPTQNRFAVVSGGEYRETKLVRNIPSVQVYSFAEDDGDGDGVLDAVSVSFEQVFQEAFFVRTNTTAVSIGDITLEHSFTTNLVSSELTTNWIYVVQVDPLRTRTNSLWNAVLPEHRPPPDDVKPVDERFLVPEAGMEYPVLAIRDFYEVTTNSWYVTNYVWSYQVSTNANFLSSATDVAFLGNAGLVIPISDCGYQEYYDDRQWETGRLVSQAHDVSGLAVFDLSDPAKQALVFPCATNLPGKISGICVDPDSGDLYVSVPTASAVFRYRAPGSGPGSWLTLPDRTVVVPDPDFSAGLPGMAGSDEGLLSNPEAVSLWNPDGAGPILLVADKANDRVSAFDPGSTWTATNWLGPTFRPAYGAGGLPVDPRIGFQALESADGSVKTNWCRVESPAFPLFSIAPSSDPFVKPRGAWGRDGSPEVVVADSSGRRIRIYSVGLDGLDPADILSLGLVWSDPVFPDLAARDWIVTNLDGRTWAVPDAPHANPGMASVLVTQESDTAVNALRFTVAPARHERVYTLAVSPAAGPVGLVSDQAVVAPGMTEGSFSFTAADGIVATVTNLTWWATNAVPFNLEPRFREQAFASAADVAAAAAADGMEWTPARVETNVWRALPVYDLRIEEAGGYSTNAPLAVLNADPVPVKAEFVGYVVRGMSEPYIVALGLRVAAEDVAADEAAGLKYLWWATEDVDWGVNNRTWAVTNNAWAADATPTWTHWTNGTELAKQVVTNTVLDEFSQTVSAVVVTNEASFFAERTVAGDGFSAQNTVVEGVDVYVARGSMMPLPFGLHRQGVAAAVDTGTSGFFVACTVLDKDGGYRVFVFPERLGPSDYETDVWDGLDETRNVSETGEPEGFVPVPVPDPAVYAAVFTAVSGTNFAFRVTATNGTPATTDTLTLQYAAVPAGDDGAWARLFTFSPGVILVYGMTVSGETVTLGTGETATATLVPDTSAATIDADFVYDAEPAATTRFYRITQP